VTATHADIPGGRLGYELTGPEGAPVLLLCHSIGTSRALWDPQLPALAARHRVLRYDHRGHGASTATPGPYTIEGLARDALALLDELGLARVSVCGLSLGGQVALWLACFAPERVDRLVLANTAARLGTRALWDDRIAAVEQGGLVPMADGVMARWLSEPFRQAHPRETQRLRAIFLATPAAGYAACCAALRDADLRDAASSVRAPTLLVAGARDVATPPADLRALEGWIPGARYVELPAAHLSNVEAADAFTAAVAQHLEP
jgi:3-oxoadipate enol-lactonase